MIGMDPTQEGRKFEEEWAHEMGLKQVPGSGNQFHSKLDNYGFGARWSLKFTKFKSFSLSIDIIREMVDACTGPGGTGEIPVLGVRLGGDSDYDLVVMRKGDFRRLAQGELTLTMESKGDAKRRRAAIPELFRDDGDPED